MLSSTDLLRTVRDRIVRVLQDVIGYEIAPETDRIADIDSLQVLEFLVSLEDEFDIDSDQIIEAHVEWWSSIDELTGIVAGLITEHS